MLQCLLACLLGVFLSSSALAAEHFVCKTKKHTVTVQLLPSGGYQYQAWTKPKNTNNQADITLHNGREVVEGTGICRYKRWEFNNGNVQYIVSTPVTCTETIPPANATGQLSVFINGEHIKSWWCLE